MTLLMPERPEASPGAAETDTAPLAGGLPSDFADLGADGSAPERPVESVSTTAAFVLPAVNLLPRAYAERAARRRAVFFAVVCLMTALLVGLLGWLIAWQAAASAQANLDEASARRAALQVETTKYSQVPLVFAALNRGQGHLSDAMGTEVRWSYFLNDIALILPRGVRLDELSLKGLEVGAAGSTVSDPIVGGVTNIGTMRISGKASSYGTVANTLDALAKADTLALAEAAKLTRVEDGGAKVVDYSISATITEQAESGRFRISQNSEVQK